MFRFIVYFHVLEPNKIIKAPPHVLHNICGKIDCWVNNRVRDVAAVYGGKGGLFIN